MFTARYGLGVLYLIQVNSCLDCGCLYDAVVRPSQSATLLTCRRRLFRDIVIDVARLRLVKLGMTHRLSCHCADAFQTYLARSFVTICTDLECSLGHEREPREKNAKSTKRIEKYTKTFHVGKGIR